MSVEESQAAMEARWYCWVTHGGEASTIVSLSPHASIGSWTIESLAHQMPDALNYRAGPQPGGPSMCLICGTTERDPRQGSPLSAWTGGAMEKDWLKRPSDHQVQETRKKTLRQSMSLHTWHRQGPHKPSSCATFTLNSHWGRATTGQKCLASMQTGSLESCPTPCDPVDCGRPGFSVRERGSPGKNTGVYWPILVATPLTEHYVSCCPSHQLPWVPGAARTLATQAAAPPPHLGLTGANPRPPGQPQEQTPVDDPYVEVEIKPQLNPRGSMAKEEDPKPSHQLYKLQIKSTWSTRQTVSMEYIKGHWEL